MGFDLTSWNPSDRDASGLGVFALGLWRIAPDSRVNPTLGLGYVRQALLSDFAGKFPIDAITDNPGQSPPTVRRVATGSNGIRLQVGGSLPLGGSNFSVTFGAMGDVLWLRNVDFNSRTHTVRDKGYGLWPRLTGGLRWNP